MGPPKYTHLMRIGTRVVVTFNANDNLEPSVGTIVADQVWSDKGQIYKVRGDDGTDNWYPAGWVSPLLKPVK